VIFIIYGVMLHDLSDADLIKQVRDRRAEGLAILYDRYRKTVYWLFARTLRNRPTAEDLVQELFLRVWNSAQQFDPQSGSVRVWILSIARNMAIDHTRSAAARFYDRVQSMHAADGQHEVTARYSTERASNAEYVRTLQAAFSCLTVKQKHVLELAYYEGLSQVEIATKLNAPLGTVKSCMRSGLLRMRNALGTSIG
jgi:RNA polymerase sigma-70 factor (ECF subfamily)